MEERPRVNEVPQAIRHLMKGADSGADESKHSWNRTRKDGRSACWASCFNKDQNETVNSPQLPAVAEDEMELG